MRIHSLFFLAITFTAAGQDLQEPTAGRLSPKEFSIPASPIFDLMGVTPSQINRTSDIKDFKVDWSFQSYKLSPNLALQSQPFWELLFNRKDLSKYQSASRFMRRLASTDVSVGSVLDESNDRRLGFAVKVNVFKQRDPLMARELFEDIGEKYVQEKHLLDSQYMALRIHLDTTVNILEKPEIRSQIKAVEEQLLTLHSRRNAEINGRAQIYVDEYWNASSLDMAFGRVYAYQTDSTGSLKSLRLNRNTGWAAWVNGSLGLGKRWLLSGLLRSSWYDEQLDFLMIDQNTLEEIPHQAIARNRLYSLGLNLRYGGSIYTFFVEYLHEKKGFSTPMEALTESFTASHNMELVKSSVMWDMVYPTTVSFGGDWRVSRSVILNYGMRCTLDSDWNVKYFVPVVSISCMMR